MKVLFVLKIHCHLVQMTCVLSVKERCPWVCLYTDPYGGGWVNEEALASRCSRWQPDSISGGQTGLFSVILSVASLVKRPWPLSLFPTHPDFSVCHAVYVWAGALWRPHLRLLGSREEHMWACVPCVWALRAVLRHICVVCNWEREPYYYDVQK